MENQKETADAERAAFRARSEGRRNEIATLVHNAVEYDPTNSEVASFFIALFMPFVQIPIFFDTSLDWFSQQWEILKIRSKYMKSSWDLFEESKAILTREDKDSAFRALKSAQDILNNAWQAYKDERSKYMSKRAAEHEIRRVEKERLHAEYLERRRIGAEKHANWRQRTEKNLEKNIERAARLREVLRTKIAYRQRCEENLRTARSAEFRAATLEKLSSVVDDVQEISSKIDKLDEFIAEDRRRLRERIYS